MECWANKPSSGRESASKIYEPFSGDPCAASYFVGSWGWSSSAKACLGDFIMMFALIYYRKRLKTCIGLQNPQTDLIIWTTKQIRKHTNESETALIFGYWSLWGDVVFQTSWLKILPKEITGKRNGSFHQVSRNPGATFWKWKNKWIINFIEVFLYLWNF